MYNGIGITSVRGTGTSGYVQTNKFNLRGPPQQRRERDDSKGPSKREPNAAILEHNRKREIEVQVELMRDDLEEEGLSEEEIEEKLAAYRAKLIAKAEEEKQHAGVVAAARSRGCDQETHHVAARKAQQMDKLKNAFGFTEDIKEGDAFNRELQEQKKLDRIAEREAKEAARIKQRQERERRREKEAKRFKKEQKKRRREEEEEQRRAKMEKRREEKRSRKDTSEKAEIEDGEAPRAAAVAADVRTAATPAAEEEELPTAAEKRIEKIPSASPPRKLRHDSSESDRSPSPDRRRRRRDSRSRSRSATPSSNDEKRERSSRGRRRSRSPSSSSQSPSYTSSGTSSDSYTSRSSGSDSDRR